MFPSTAVVFHTADAAAPSIGTRQRSPSFATSSALPSWLQNAPTSELPAPGSSRGGADGVARYTLETPARSQTKATDRPSGLHMGDEGWRMSISCSIVNDWRAAAA